jgi:hypothetical protein
MAVIFCKWAYSSPLEQWLSSYFLMIVPSQCLNRSKSFNRDCCTTTAIIMKVTPSLEDLLSLLSLPSLSAYLSLNKLFHRLVILLCLTVPRHLSLLVTLLVLVIGEHGREKYTRRVSWRSVRLKRRKLPSCKKLENRRTLSCAKKCCRHQ